MIKKRILKNIHGPIHPLYDTELLFIELLLPCNLNLIGPLQVYDLEERNYEAGYNESYIF